MPEPVPVSKANMDPVFESRLQNLQTQAAQEVTTRALGQQVRWFRPEATGAAVGWPGDLFDLASFGPPYSRQASNDDYVAATSDPDNPGTSGDLVASTLQIDYLAMQERALRNRHTMRRPRAMAHVLARLNGHGDSLGVYGIMLEQLREVLRLAKEPPA